MVCICTCAALASRRRRCSVRAASSRGDSSRGVSIRSGTRSPSAAIERKSREAEEHAQHLQERREKPQESHVSINQPRVEQAAGQIAVDQERRAQVDAQEPQEDPQKPAKPDHAAARRASIAEMESLVAELEASVPDTAPVLELVAAVEQVSEVVILLVALR